MKVDAAAMRPRLISGLVHDAHAALRAQNTSRQPPAYAALQKAGFTGACAYAAVPSLQAAFAAPLLLGGAGLLVGDFGLGLAGSGVSAGIVSQVGLLGLGELGLRQLGAGAARVGRPGLAAVAQGAAWLCTLAIEPVRLAVAIVALQLELVSSVLFRAWQGAGAYVSPQAKSAPATATTPVGAPSASAAATQGSASAAARTAAWAAALPSDAGSDWTAMSPGQPSSAKANPPSPKATPHAAPKRQFHPDWIEEIHVRFAGVAGESTYTPLSPKVHLGAGGRGSASRSRTRLRAASPRRERSYEGGRWSYQKKARGAGPFKARATEAATPVTKEALPSNLCDRLTREHSSHSAVPSLLEWSSTPGAAEALDDLSARFDDDGESAMSPRERFKAVRNCLGDVRNAAEARRAFKDRSLRVHPDKLRDDKLTPQARELAVAVQRCLIKARRAASDLPF